MITKIFKKILRKISFPFSRRYIEIKSKKDLNIISCPFEIVWVPTSLINEMLISFARISREVPIPGIIMDGKWDEKTIKFDRHHDFIAFRQRFYEGKKWEDTIYYDIFTKKGKIRSCKNWKDYQKKHLERWDRLYESIKMLGYKTQEQKNLEKRSGFIQKSLEGKPENEIVVCISNDEKIYLIDGKHRLSIAKILGIKKVPVIVGVWHKEFIEKVKKESREKKITPQIAIDYAIKNN